MHQQQLQPPPLPARQRADRGEGQLPGEPEALHQLDVGQRPGGAVGAGHQVLHPGLEVELDALLVVVADDHRRPDLHRPGRGPAPPGQEVDQGRLPGPVGADDAQALAPAEDEIDAGQHQRPVAVAEPDAVHSMTLSPSRGVIAGQLELGRPGRGLGAVLDEPDGGVDPGLGLAGAGLGAPAEPGQLPPGQVAPGGFGRRGLLLAFGPGLQVGGVAPFVHVGAAPVELEHPGGDPVEQVAVVGDEDQAAPEGQQLLLEPGHRAQVEVVGGLVEDQQLGRVGQHPGQGHPLGLAAREGGHVGVGRRGHAQPVEGRLGLPALADRVGTVPGGSIGHLLEEADPRAPAPPDLALVGAGRRRR